MLLISFLFVTDNYDEVVVGGDALWEVVEGFGSAVFFFEEGFGA